MGFVNEKFLRFVLTVVGVGALALFGYKMVDFVRHPEVYKGGLGDEDLVRIRRGFSQSSVRATPASHLQEYASYAIIQDLNITGYVPPVVIDTGPVQPISRGVSARDLEVPFLQYPNGAWVQPAGAQTTAGSEDVPGDMYLVGQEFEIDTHVGTRLRLEKVEVDKVVIVVVKTGDELVVRAGDMPLNMRDLLGDPNAEQAGNVQQLPPPEYTMADDTGVYRIGTADAKELRLMTEEEVLSAVSVRPARNEATNEVRGLRLQRLNHPVFQRMGLQQDDVVLEVNGKPALDRDEVLRQMREYDGNTVTLRVERLGGVRTISYRLPG